MLGRFSIGLLFAAVGSASAFAEDPYGTAHRDMSNVRLEVAVSSALPTFALSGPDVPVSGTNVTVAARASVVASGLEPWRWGGFEWTNVLAVAFSFTIGGHSVGTEIPFPGTDEHVDSVRFASTHFPDGTSLPLTVATLFRLQGWQNGLPVETYEYLETTAVVTVHNKGLTWATREEWDTSQDPDAFVVPNPEWSDGAAPVARAGAQAANATFAATNHSVLNPNANLQQTTESQLATMLKTATYVLAMTHGEPTNFRSSAYDQLHFAFAPNQTSEVRDYVKTGRTAPSPNIVVMHACKTMVNTYHAPYAFDVHDIDPNGTITNRAYAGYTAKVMERSINGQRALDEHAAHLYGKLALGWTIRSAIESANEFFIGSTNQKTALKMIFRGDQYARIVSAYQISHGVDSWFLRL